MSAQGSAPRATLDLKVRVWGMGANDQPFFQNATAQNISATGACVYGIEAELKVGDVIAVQYEGKKARCKVIWVVDAGQVQKISVGVNLVEGQPCPWEKELQRTPPESERAPRVAPSDEDKRNFPRHRVPFPIEIRDQDAVGAYMNTKSADISARGCYVETMLPLPVGKVLNISFWLDSERIRTPAVVRSSDGGVGMGIEFTGLDEKTQERLQQQVDTMAAEAEPSKNVQGAV